MGLFKKKEYLTQLYFGEDNKVSFLKRELKYSCLIEKEGENLVRGWKHFYGNQLRFVGYGAIPAAMVTLGFARDVILDPFNKVPIGEAVSEKPKAKDSIGLRKWISKIAENQRHIYRAERKSTAREDIINYCLMGVLGVMLLAWLVSFLVGLYA